MELEQLEQALATLLKLKKEYQNEYDQKQIDYVMGLLDSQIGEIKTRIWWNS